MTDDNSNSEKFRTLYQDENRDEFVFTLGDAIGLQIVRKYPNKMPLLSDKRMFMKIFLIEDKVFGGVDMVSSEEKRWVVVNEQFKKISNFFFRSDEGLRFNFENQKFSYKKREYTLNEIVNILEKTHLSDIYRVSRWLNYLYEILLKLIFFGVDREYDRMDFLLSHSKGRAEREAVVKDVRLVPDPFFKYFYIYKNILAFSLGILLPLMYKLSLSLDTNYFTIQNPFFFFSAIAFLLLLEGLGSTLQFQINKKDGFISKLAQKSITPRGHLKI